MTTLGRQCIVFLFLAAFSRCPGFHLVRLQALYKCCLSSWTSDCSHGQDTYIFGNHINTTCLDPWKWMTSHYWTIQIGNHVCWMQDAFKQQEVLWESLKLLTWQLSQHFPKAHPQIHHFHLPASWWDRHLHVGLLVCFWKSWVESSALSGRNHWAGTSWTCDSLPPPVHRKHVAPTTTFLPYQPLPSPKLNISIICPGRPTDCPS